MISNEYQLAWLLYLVAALGCFWVWTFFTRWMWRYLREPLWLVAAVVLFSPTLADPNGSAWVPSLAMAAMDIAFKVNNDAWRALADMLFYGTVAAVVYVIFALLRFVLEYYWLKPRKAARLAARQAEEKAKQQDKDAAAQPELRREPVIQDVSVARPDIAALDGRIVAER